MKSHCGTRVIRGFPPKCFAACARYSCWVMWSGSTMWKMPPFAGRSEEHTSELQSLMRISYAVFCLKKKNYSNIIIVVMHFTINVITHQLYQICSDIANHT